MKQEKQPLFEKIDCIHLQVADLDEGISFYHEALGLKLLWRTKTACGLGLRDDVTEIVLSCQDFLTVDIKVEDVERALPVFVAAGGRV